MPRSASAAKPKSALGHLEKPKLLVKGTISQDRTGPQQGLLIAISHRQVVLKGGRFEGGVGKKDKTQASHASSPSASSVSFVGLAFLGIDRSFIDRYVIGRPRLFRPGLQSRFFGLGNF